MNEKNLRELAVMAAELEFERRANDALSKKCDELQLRMDQLHVATCHWPQFAGPCPDCTAARSRGVR